MASTSLLQTLPAGEGAAAGALAAAGRKAAAYVELAKPRVASLIVLVSAAAFWLGSSGLDAARLAWLLTGVALLAAGIFALNQYMERDLDGLMRRTASRPLPQGRLRPAEAFWAGSVLSLTSVVLLSTTINALSGLLAVFTLVSYLLVYTPLKTRTAHCTLVGAVPGAMPPVFGWIAVRGELDSAALALFAILFCWQFPHFHAIAMLYREDYAGAGIRLWPVVEPEGTTTGRQILFFTLLLLPASIAPVLLNLTGMIYLWGALLLHGLFLYYSLRCVIRQGTKQEARKLLLVSVLYLPALFVLMVLDK